MTGSKTGLEKSLENECTILERRREPVSLIDSAHAQRVALVGNYPPRRCGIATFTSDLREALIGCKAGISCDVYALSEIGSTHAYPSDVVGEIQQNSIHDYVEIARKINRSGAAVVSIQHEFGIFGGNAGESVLILLDLVAAPVVTTLHTVLANPSVDQRRVMTRLTQRSAKLVVMAEKGRQMLEGTYGVSPAKIAVIPHGTPDCAFMESAPFKGELGLLGRNVLLTFGLLSPNKGIEFMIRSLPEIVARFPNLIYVVLGAMHPHLVAQEGEAYRDKLLALARELDVAEHIRFVDQYVDNAKLIRYLAAADVYVTPYLNEAQITSGTLAYAVGLGKAVVSTPYWHAEELLADNRGVLVPFGDSAALGRACTVLLKDASRRDAIRVNAYKAGRRATWRCVGERYASLFRRIAGAPDGAERGIPSIAFMNSDAVPGKGSSRRAVASR